MKSGKEILILCVILTPVIVLINIVFQTSGTSGWIICAYGFTRFIQYQRRTKCKFYITEELTKNRVRVHHYWFGLLTLLFVGIQTTCLVNFDFGEEKLHYPLFNFCLLVVGLIWMLGVTIYFFWSEKEDIKDAIKHWRK